MGKTNDSLFEENQKLVHDFVFKEFYKYKENMEYDDFKQLAFIGLFKASKSFDPNLRL